MRVKRCKNDKIALSIVCHCVLASIIPFGTFQEVDEKGVNLHTFYIA